MVIIESENSNLGFFFFFFFGYGKVMRVLSTDLVAQLCLVLCMRSPLCRLRST
jgi:hypothetical protein